ncbi:MAG: MBL fold metallo-hydrolase, partial [Pseudomonadota bacterium]
MRLDQTPRFVTSGWVEVPEAAVLRGGSWRTRRLPVRYGLLDHPVAGLTLIDTGYTPHTVTDPGRSLSMKINSALLRAKLSPEGQPEAVLARFGRGLSDVACVILTHFHADHVSGLRLFENARFIGARADLEVMGRRARWRNAAQGMFDALLPTDFHERFEPIEACAQVDRARLSGLRDLFGDGSLCAVPLPGHTQGHFGLFYHTAGGPVLYGCDAQYV